MMSQKDFSVNYGLVFIGYGSGCFLGPVIGGYVHDIMHSYYIAFYLSGVLSLFGAFMVFKWLRDGGERVDCKMNSIGELEEAKICKEYLQTQKEVEKEALAADKEPENDQNEVGSNLV